MIIEDGRYADVPRRNSIEDAMQRTGGRPRGFDYLRLVLAISVLVWHAGSVSHRGQVITPLVRMVLPMFFALSGFLISGSLLRTRTIGEFVMLRAIRIMPALVVETVISLVIIGSLFTTLPLGEFYTDPMTFRYLLNMIGWVHFTLPGVFEHLPVTRVNWSLWTVPFELECYIAIVILWMTGIIKRTSRLLIACIIYQIGVFALDYYHGEVEVLTLPVEGRILITAFLFGVLLYRFREYVILNAWLCLAAAAITLIMLQSEVASYFIALPVAYVTVWLGTLNPPRIPVILDGDYSYGMYLYAYPIQQAVTSITPLSYRQWYINAPVSLIIVSVFAAFSWHMIEKPILHRRKHLVGEAERLAARLRGLRQGPADPVFLAPMDIKAQDRRDRSGFGSPDRSASSPSDAQSAGG